MMLTALGMLALSLSLPRESSLLTVALAGEMDVPIAKRLVASLDEPSLRREASLLGWRMVSQGSVHVVIDPETEAAGALDALAALGAFDASEDYAPVLATELTDKKLPTLFRAATPWADPSKTPTRDYAFVLRVSVSGTLNLNGKTVAFRMMLPDLAKDPPRPTRQPEPRTDSPKDIKEATSKMPAPVDDTITCVFSNAIPAEERPDVAARAMAAVKERRTAALQGLEAAKKVVLDTFVHRSGILGGWDGHAPIALESLSLEAQNSILASMRVSAGGALVTSATMDAWRGAKIIDAKPVLSIGTRSQDVNGRISDSLTNLGGKRWAPRPGARP